MTWSEDFLQTRHPVTHSLSCGWWCNVKFRNPSATVVILGACLMGLMTVAGEYRRDERCLIAHAFLESAIQAYLGWVLFIGMIGEG